MMRGGSLQALQTILGHATPTMTARYADLSPDFLRREIERTAGGSELAISTKSAHDLAQADETASERVQVRESSGAGGGS
jgi:hypothetical protein